jgi:hypothetical protein
VERDTDVGEPQAGTFGSVKPHSTAANHRHQSTDAAVKLFFATIGKEKIGPIHRAQRRNVYALR